MPARIDPLEPRRLMSAVSFTIDSDISSLTIDAKGNVKHVGSVGLDAQADGLDTAHYRGTLVADVGPSGIKFNGGSTIDAIEHAGSYSPSNGPADYAVDGKVKKLFVRLATLKADLVDLSLDLTSSSRKQRGNDKRFALRNTVMTATAGTLNYHLDSKFGNADGSKSISGLKANVRNGFAKLTGQAGSRILTVPIDLTFTRDLANGTSAKFSLTGQLVGHETSTASASSLTAAAAVTPTIATKSRATHDVLDATV